jgi:hypothetical protein
MAESAPDDVPARRSRRKRDAHITCSHCLQSIQLETFRSHVLHYWENGTGKWILSDDCLGCEHDHIPTSTEMVHIHKVQQEAVKERAAAKRRRKQQHRPHQPPDGDISESDHEDGHHQPDVGDMGVDIGVQSDMDSDGMDVEIGVHADDLHSHMDEDAAGADVVPAWMSFRPGPYIPPCSVRRIDLLVEEYELAHAEVQDVVQRIDL